MQTSIEKTGAISRKLTVIVPSDRIQKASQLRLKEISKTAKIDGFRKGKIPIGVIKARYGESVHFEVIEKVIDDTLREALIAEKINPAAVPDVIPTVMEPGKDLEYVADFDLMPELENVDLKGTKVKIVEATITKRDVDNSLEQLRKQQVKWSDVTRKAKNGDRMILDFVGTIDGLEFAGGKSDDMPIVLGEGQMLPDFEKGLIGLKTGEQTDIKVGFPEDYPGKEVSGKKADFSISVKSVSTPELPDIDDAFAEKYSSKDLAGLRAEVEKTMGVNVENALNSTNRTRVFDALLGKTKVDVPRKLIQEEIQRMVEHQKGQMQQRGMDPEVFDGNTEAFEPEAKKRVALGLVMMQYIRDNGIQVDAVKVQDYVAKMAAGYEDPAQFIAYYNEDKERLAQIESVVLETQVVDHLLELATVSKEKVDVKELLDGKIT